MWLPSLVIWLLLSNISGTNVIDLPDTVEEIDIPISASRREMYSDTNESEQDEKPEWQLRQKEEYNLRQSENYKFRQSEDYNIGRKTQEYQDVGLKKKISSLVEQTMHDTHRKMNSIQSLRERNRDALPYRAGFVLSRIKKERDVLNELFNVAVKHRDDWKALEQLKVFELIVHANVDTTNLVRQLVEIHLQHLNSTNSQTTKKRVVLL